MNIELKENEKLVHIFKYENKEIPLYYNVDKIKDRIIEVTEVLKLYKDYLLKNNIVFSEEEKGLIMAEEDICSSYIEGYETYLTPEFVLKGYTSGSLADRTTLSGFEAYKYAFIEYFNKGKDVNNSKDIVDIWKKLVKYKRFFRKNIRMTGVRVGNMFYTAHIAPNAKYIRPLLNDMFESLNAYKNEHEDEYKLLNGILFHYIFTFIHPFIDGNGRLSRLLTNKILIDKGLDKFRYISLNSEIVKDKHNYGLQLKNIETSEDYDLTEYIRYMLNIIYRLLDKICNPQRRKLDFSTLSDRQKVMLNYIMSTNSGIYVKQYKEYWNFIAKQEGYKTILISDAEKDLMDLFFKDFIVLDDRYVRYVGFKYYNK